MNTYPITDTFGLTYQIEGHSYRDALQIAKSMGIDYLIDLNEPGLFEKQELPANSAQTPAKQAENTSIEKGYWVYKLRILDARDRYWDWTCTAKTEAQALYFWATTTRNSYKLARIINSECNPS